MTCNTKSHLKLFLFDPVHGFNRTVALPTGDFLFDMSLMIEQHVLGQIINFNPRYRGFVVKIPVYCYNLGVFGYNEIMAVETFSHRWYSRTNRPADIWMTKPALNFLNPGMEPMAERYRLFGSDIDTWRDIEIIHKHRDRDHQSAC